MGREVRRVPADWVHPVDHNGSHTPLLGRGFKKESEEWAEGSRQWAMGLRSDHDGGWQKLTDEEKEMSFEEWHGPQPRAEDFMPEWPDSECTHLQMYETCSEGTPISPVMKTPEELAHWLADNNASSFGPCTATYEQWLSTIARGYSVGAVIGGGQIVSGVEAGF